MISRNIPMIIARSSIITWACITVHLLAGCTSSRMTYDQAIEVFRMRDVRKAKQYLKAGGDPNLPDAEVVACAPLHHAAANNDVQMIALLRDWGANLHARNTLGMRPIDMAYAFGHEEACEALRVDEIDQEEELFAGYSIAAIREILRGYDSGNEPVVVLVNNEETTLQNILNRNGERAPSVENTEDDTDMQGIPHSGPTKVIIQITNEESNISWECMNYFRHSDLPGTGAKGELVRQYGYWISLKTNAIDY